MLYKQNCIYFYLFLIKQIFFIYFTLPPLPLSRNGRAATVTNPSGPSSRCVSAHKYFTYNGIVSLRDHGSEAASSCVFICPPGAHTITDRGPHALKRHTQCATSTDEWEIWPDSRSVRVSNTDRRNYFDIPEPPMYRGDIGRPTETRSRLFDVWCWRITARLEEEEEEDFDWVTADGETMQPRGMQTWRANWEETNSVLADVWFGFLLKKSQ